MTRRDRKPAGAHVAPVERATPLREQVYEALEELIIRGELAPGQRLREVDLAQLLGVSRNPVREAMSALQRDGWLRFQPHHGAYVRQPTLKEIEDFFLVRTLLEVEAVRHAAKKATPEAIAELEALVRVGREAIRSGTEQTIVEANNKFHKRLVAMADNETLTELLRAMSKRLRWYFGEVALARGADSWHEHAELIEALKLGDSDRVAAIMQKHADATTNAYRRAHRPTS